mmetsp:Transcript_5079/g.17717  ORF Transcript_5079/g.17717 Transcript_5079/m.17717 type:complete len:200 (-) Transcript_5079:728-1327(-)
MATRPQRTCDPSATPSWPGAPLVTKPTNSGPRSLAQDVKVESSVDIELVMNMMLTTEKTPTPRCSATAAGRPALSLESSEGSTPSGLRVASMLPYTPSREKSTMKSPATEPPTVNALRMVLGSARKQRSVSTGSKKGYDSMPCMRPTTRRSMPPSRLATSRLSQSPPAASHVGSAVATQDEPLHTPPTPVHVASSAMVA